MELKRVDPDYKELPDACQSAALRGMLTGKRKDRMDMQLAVGEYGTHELLNAARRCVTLTEKGSK